MISNEIQIQPTCPVADISAYLDGELSPQAEMDLELHFAGCAMCTTELNDQKNLLRALDSTLDESQFELPKDFSKAVVANAESRVSGLRRPKERFNALLICGGLLLLSLFALGENAGRTLGALSSGFQAVAAVAETCFHFVYDLSLGAAVIFRSLFSNFVFGSPASALLFVAVFFAIIFIFSRLFFRPSGT